MRKWLKHLKNQKGLTLIELLAVVVILGIIAAIAVPAIGNIIDNSKEDAHRSNALLIINAAKLGKTDGTFKNSDFTGTNSVTLQELVDAGYLDAVPADPSFDGKSYYSTSKVTKNANQYLITLYNFDGSHSYYNAISESKLNSDTKPVMP
ncbi:prepilin-type N-terminal cleavage/methylation domain-containing protein [Paenisporosarcina cavernae]|uniref:Prepilin-type N-terminal cleavage/methylation domain-containing protein n=1 Tax=Paenisporosarcina cavernae TaxID=2320858 RepID=A0A385YW43_9BACL|nr:prepilin-type N-terminal cleavage/methylation domain-containing protein [Paenisporosarcina cavernae]AYC29753.1 prepilin-type N-terminal cleavage/methylation domain-containing protein [Paenisporosarcina cavernae]